MSETIVERDGERVRLVFLHPLCVRAWHWVNALAFLVLIVTGFSMHFSGSEISALSFGVSMTAHNVAGAIVVVGWVLYLIGLAVSGEWRQLLRVSKGMTREVVTQTRYYLLGVFRGEPHPDEPTREKKFNPLQQITYAAVILIGFPLLIVTGIMLLNPEWAPREVLGGGGVWPVAALHTLAGYALTAFTIGHIYLTTLGHHPLSNIRGMFTGWVELPPHASHNSNGSAGETHR